MADHPSVSFKDATVNPFGIHPRIKSAIFLAADLMWQTAGKECVITSLCDGLHGANSYHYLHGAVDLRSKHLTDEEASGVLERLRLKLGDQWDVLLEDRGQSNEHFHLEVEIRDQLEERIRGKQEALASEWNEQLGGGQ